VAIFTRFTLFVLTNLSNTFPIPLKVEHAYLIFREKWFHFAHWGGGIIALIIINIIIIIIVITILTIILAIITSQTVQVLVYLATL